MFCIQQKKGQTIWYYSPIAYPAFTGHDFKGKGALSLVSLKVFSFNIPRMKKIWSSRKYSTVTIKLLRDRSKFKLKYCFPFLSKLQNFWQMFSVAIHLHFIKANIHKFKIPRKISILFIFSIQISAQGHLAPPQQLKG